MSVQSQSSCSVLNGQNITSGFIDLATYDELEKSLYGGLKSTSYFVRETRKSTWFSQIPVVLQRSSGCPDFGEEFSVSVSRAGDYLLDTWLRLTTPVISSLSTSLAFAWTNNLMHNLIVEACITFNDLVAARFDKYFLDFWTAFTVPGSKKSAYNTMIGNISELTIPSAYLPGRVLNLPLPFFYSRDSGVALPTAALPYNDIRISLTFNSMENLLGVFVPTLTPNDNALSMVCTPLSSVSNATTFNELTSSDNILAPDCIVQGIKNAQVWANYAIVSNDERKRMACAPRDILIEQVQTAPVRDYNPVANGTSQYDVRFSHAIKLLLFGARNITCPQQGSNYSTMSNTYVQNEGATRLEVLQKNSLPVLNGLVLPPAVTEVKQQEIGDYQLATVDGISGTNSNFAPSVVYQGPNSYQNDGYNGLDNTGRDNENCKYLDPVGRVSLLYENTYRLASMVNEYFSLVDAYYDAPTAPSPDYGAPLSVSGAQPAGYHMYSYSLDFICLDPMGSTNFGKLTNVSMNVAHSAAAVSAAAAVGSAAEGGGCAQKFQFVVLGVNNNIIRVSGGALGFPVL